MTQGQLELRKDGGRPLHFLAGKPLEPGATIEILLDGDRWLGGRYEWTGSEARWPSLRIDLGGGVSRTTAPPIPPDAVLRWRP